MRLFKLIFASLAALAVLAWVLVFLLSRDFLRHPDQAAFDFLDATPNGVVNPPWNATHWYGEWKAAFLVRTAPQLEAGVFGLSTVMTLSAQSIPTQKLFNYSSVHSFLDVDTEEISYALDHAPKLKTIILGYDLFPAFYQMGKENELPRVKNVLETGAYPNDYSFDLHTLYSYYEAFAEGEGLREAFWYLQISSNAMTDRIERRWRRLQTSGTHEIGKWFEPMVYNCPWNPGLAVFDIGNLFCNGFYADGSFNFGPIRFASVHGVFMGWIPDANQYAFAVQNKDTFELNINHRLSQGLTRISELFQTARKKGIYAYLLFPPLEPGLAAKVLATPVIGEDQRRYKAAIEDFAKAHDIRILDTSASEQFGCTKEQFLNENHATADCYKLVFKNLNLKNELAR
jgi:hypothetical protein